MRKYTALKAALLVSAILFSNICTLAGQTSLKGGCAKIDITPPVGAWLAGYRVREKPSDGISDQLYAKAMVLDDGRNKVAIVSADLLWVSLEVTTDVRKTVKERVGIAEENVLICATHTHFGPKIDRLAKDWPDAPVSEIDQSYIQTLKQKIADSIIAADKKVKEVKVGVVKGEIPEVVYNRRTKRSNGSVAMTFRLPPAEPNLTFGPIDPQVSILKIEDANGALVGALVNFACHPVCGGPGREKFYSISADYPGRTAQVVEQMEGGICLFALGTAGDMNPVMADRKNPRSQIGRALGGEVLRRIQFVPTSGEITLRAMKKPVILPIKENLSPDRIVEADKTKKTLTTELQVLRIADFYILGLPSEVLVEIGLDIKRKAGIENLFIISLSNDACGYICHKQAYKEGGYEPGDGTNLAEGAGEIIIKQALDILVQIKRL
ncbi:MAG: neutral/alkaline non-lysosomal ceramidase N-terminal domain-containing protein [Planctomycetota bacterium]|nr:neutral/alkaline non-lysosomal ceramidase N-terminal domain-containing protein [Planctomycetota bacterium]